MSYAEKHGLDYCANTSIMYIVVAPIEMVNGKSQASIIRMMSRLSMPTRMAIRLSLATMIVNKSLLSTVPLA